MLLNFKNLYQDIKNHGYNYKKYGYIIVSKDGARVDGSHRATIIEHLKYDNIKVRRIKWEKVLKTILKKATPRDQFVILRKIRKHIKKQRKKYIH